MLATDNCPDENVEKYKYIKESGIRVGPAVIRFEELQKNENQKIKAEDNKDTNEKIKGTYIVDKGEPVQKINPETGVPIKDKKGQVLYERKPTEICPLHNEGSNSILDYICNLWGKD